MVFIDSSILSEETHFPSRPPTRLRGYVQPGLGRYAPGLSNQTRLWSMAVVVKNRATPKWNPKWKHGPKPVQFPVVTNFDPYPPGRLFRRLGFDLGGLTPAELQDTKLHLVQSKILARLPNPTRPGNFSERKKEKKRKNGNGQRR